jgi:hypothetical protein
MAPVPAVEERLPERDSLIAQARALQIVDDESYGRAGENLKAIMGLLDVIDESCDPLIQQAHQTHKDAIKQKKGFQGDLPEAKGILRSKIGEREAELDRIARAEEARLAAEAKERDEAARLKEAVALDEAGEHEEADRVLDEPSLPPPPSVAVHKPKVEGVSTRYLYSTKLKNLDELTDAAAATPKGSVERRLLAFNQTPANQLARALKEDFRVPGVELVKTPSVSVRR